MAYDPQQVNSKDGPVCQSCAAIPTRLAGGIPEAGLVLPSLKLLLLSAHFLFWTRDYARVGTV